MFSLFSNIGLGFKTPKEAIEGTYIDKKCPFTGNVSIRGRILKGIVKSAKMKRTISTHADQFVGCFADRAISFFSCAP